MSNLMALKVLLLIGLGAAFVWWQMHDLAKEKKRTAEREAERDNDKSSRE